jgi:hypothetical protein
MYLDKTPCFLGCKLYIVYIKINKQINIYILLLLYIYILLYIDIDIWMALCLELSKIPSKIPRKSHDYICSSKPWDPNGELEFIGSFFPKTGTICLFNIAMENHHFEWENSL